jgi:hypothetical protein
MDGGFVPMQGFVVSPESGVGALAIVVAGLFVLAVRAARPRATWATAAVVVALMTVQWVLAQRGILQQWDRTPPPLMALVAVMVAITVACAFRLGPAIVAAVPLWAIVGAQAFRLPLELLMHRAAETGAMPVVMSYSGGNFDIVTGASALVVAVLALIGRAPRWLIVAWNLVGSLLLLTIVTIAILATPLIGAFGPGQLNTWVVRAPVVWLPGVLVPAALFGHLILWRALFRRDVLAL